ncbi:hypothetical protein MUP01_02260 [Candidatus Bathyarchaeota archaeon]|nr:hypothetical protein [Candidatus Bathyarchaeota archaeon]
MKKTDPAHRSLKPVTGGEPERWAESHPIIDLLAFLFALWVAYLLVTTVWQVCHGNFRIIDELFNQKDV